MGNAEDDVKGSANEVTTSNEDEGFARAVEQFICLSDVRKNKFQFTQIGRRGNYRRPSINIAS